MSGLSFEVKSGEILAVLATSQQEATGLLDVLAGSRKASMMYFIANKQKIAANILFKIWISNLDPDKRSTPTLQK